MEKHTKTGLRIVGYSWGLSFVGALVFLMYQSPFNPSTFADVRAAEKRTDEAFALARHYKSLADQAAKDHP